MTALDDVLAQARVSDEASRPRRSFTAAADRGVLATRRASAPWSFATMMLRAGLCVADRVVARVHTEHADARRRVQVDVRAQSDRWDALELGSVLEASLGLSEQEQGVARWRSRIGAAVNQALATGPSALELHTPAEARRWTLHEGARAGTDPYRVQRIATDVSEGGFSLRLVHAEDAFSATWKRWLGRDDAGSAIARAWSWALGRSVAPKEAADGVLAQRRALEDATPLGPVGHWWRAEDGGLHLIRDGVRVAELGESVAAHSSLPLAGEVACAGLRLDVDGRRPVQNDALHVLIAWLEALYPEQSTPPPDTLIDLQGRAHPVQGLRAVDEIAYAWPHQTALLQAAGLPIVPLTPLQLQWLRERTPASYVPASLFSTALAQRVDLTPLRSGAVGPIRVAFEQAEVDAYVHRHAVAQAGAIELHAFGRRVHRAEAPSLPGVTVVVTIQDQAVSEEAEHDTLVVAVREAVLAEADALTRMALKAVPDVTTRARMPWVAHRLAQLDAHGLELEYIPDAPGLRLRWRDDPLLDLVVAHERDGAPRTLREALARLRDAGGVVVGEASRRWETLESEVPVWTTWVLTERGRTLLDRIVHHDALWTMPTVPEAQLRPASLAGQPQLALTKARVAELLAATDRSSAQQARARDALLGHLAYARATGADEFGLGSVRLLRVYDPGALRPRRSIAVDALEEAGVVGVVPPRTGHRDAPGVVIEASPGVAWALAELGLSSPPAARPRSARPARVPAKAARGGRVWLRIPVAHARCYGALVVGEGPPGVQVWWNGLRVRLLQLPSPWQDVSGRVWLREGVEDDERALVHALHKAARGLEPAAAKAALLAVPNSAREIALRRFIESLPADTAPPPGRRRARVAPALGSDRLGATLRFALGRAVTVDVSRLSWTLVRVDEDDDRLKLGALHPLMRAARDDDATGSDIAAAALGILYALRRQDALDPEAFDEAAARVLAVLE
ncbi:MAG: hypothetical protein AAGA54_35645 [Myxococcota bacterium]